MSDHYKHSAQGSLTRKLVKILMGAAIIIYAGVYIMLIPSALDQGSQTQTYIVELKNTNYAEELQSRSNQLAQKLQSHVEDLAELGNALYKIHTTPEAQRQDSTTERSYYYNRAKAQQNTVESSKRLKQVENSEEWYFPGQLSGYAQKLTLTDWAEVLADEKLREILWENSGLAFLLEPWTQLVDIYGSHPSFYIGNDNGLYYQTPSLFSQNFVPGLPETLTLDPLCLESLDKISNPEPILGFDCRCRPWYQRTMDEKKAQPDEISLGVPYVDFSTNEIMSTFTSYFEVKSPHTETEQEAYEGVIAFDLTSQLANEELQQFQEEFEKFFIADSVMQTIIIKAENNNRESQELQEVTPLVNFLVNGTTDETYLAALRKDFEDDIQDQLSDAEIIKSKSVFKYNDGEKEKVLVVTPIFLRLSISKPEETTYAFMMGAVPKETIIEVTLFKWNDLKLYSFCLIALILSLLMSTYCVHKTSSAVIFPLRQLNMRMTEILKDEHLDAASLDSNNSSGKCLEIRNLQDQFSQLISDYKFTQNDFIQQESDVIALIDLAQACVLFSGSNYKALGVCYNNIANLYYKNEKYQLAADSYNKAVHMAYVCSDRMPPEEFYKKFQGEKPRQDKQIEEIKVSDGNNAKVQRRHFKIVKAHRYYQFSMCMYKIWRYQNGGDLLEQISKQQQRTEEEDNEDIGVSNETQDAHDHQLMHSITDEFGVGQVKRKLQDSRASMEADWWKFIDSCMHRAIENYKQITIDIRGHTQPLFIDLIVKMQICRAYANSMNQKPLTAHRYLKEAEESITRLRIHEPKCAEDNSSMQRWATPSTLRLGSVKDSSVHRLRQAIPNQKPLLIVNDLDENGNNVNRREGAYPIPIDALEQKLLLHKGLVLVAQGEQEKAKNFFVQCINTGHVYDARISVECCTQLRNILAQNSKVDLTLERLAESFRFRNRDFIFLVNQSQGMDAYKEKVPSILAKIMQSQQDCILSQDRVSLIKFSQRLRKIFSLVQKDSNFAQLKNQVDKLKFDEYESKQYGNLTKALLQTVSEFQEHAQHSKRSVITSSSEQQSLMDTMISEQSLQTVVLNESQTNMQITFQHQLLLQQVNRRWVICLTKNLDQASENQLLKVAEMFTLHQVNLILISFDPSERERRIGEKFVAKIKHLSADLITPVEAFLLFDPDPEQVEQIMIKRVANFKAPRNAPLIIETFA